MNKMMYIQRFAISEMEIEFLTQTLPQSVKMKVIAFNRNEITILQFEGKRLSLKNLIIWSAKAKKKRVAFLTKNLRLIAAKDEANEPYLSENSLYKITERKAITARHECIKKNLDSLMKKVAA